MHMYSASSLPAKLSLVYPIRARTRGIALLSKSQPLSRCLIFRPLSGLYIQPSLPRPTAMSTRRSTSESHPRDVSSSPRPDKRRRRCTKACERCKSRKQKCDGREPCGNCIHYKADCVFQVMTVKKADSVTLGYISALEERCAELEYAIIQVNPDHEAVQDHLASNSSKPLQPPIVSFKPLSDRGTDVRTAERLIRPESLAMEQAEVEGTIREYLEDLSAKAFAETTYIGEVSGLAFAQLAKASVRHGMHLSPAPFRTSAARKKSSTAPTLPSLPGDEEATALIHAVYMHVQARYPFIQWPLFHKWHKQRHRLCAGGHRPDTRDEQSGAFFIWMMYAVGATYLSRHEVDQHRRIDAQAYFSAAISHIDDLLNRHDLLSVQALALTAMYSFRAEDGPSVWYLVGLAMRICVEQGLHRKASETTRHEHPIATEVNSRVFWSIYTLDRLVSITLGRPMAIGDEDIDAEEPLDIDCSVLDTNALRLAQQSRCQMAKRVTSMTSACYWIRLFRIRSRIIRRLKDPMPMQDHELLALLTSLNDWKHHLPDMKRVSNGIPILSRDRFLKGYYMAVSLLLRPQTSRATSQQRVFLRHLAEASAQCCELETSIMSSDTPAHSMASLYSTFISGLTLLQALAIQPDIIPHRQSARGIRACTSVLITYATLFPEAQSFRTIFEDLVDSMEDETASEPKRPSATQPASAAPQQSQLFNPPAISLEPPSVTSTSWQQKIWEVEARLQGDLQQDLAAMGTGLAFASTTSTGFPGNPPALVPAQDLNFAEDDLFDFASYTNLS